jgi:hypothetical protein
MLFQHIGSAGRLVRYINSTWDGNGVVTNPINYVLLVNTLHTYSTW